MATLCYPDTSPFEVGRVEPGFCDLRVVPGVVAVVEVVVVGIAAFCLAFGQIFGEPGDMTASGAGDSIAAAQAFGAAESDVVTGGSAERAVLGVLVERESVFGREGRRTRASDRRGWSQ